MRQQLSLPHWPFCCCALLLAAATSASSMSPPPAAAFAVLEPSDFERYLKFGSGDGGGLKDENEWARVHIPYFEIDSEDFNVAYYFRWHMFHTHINESGWRDPHTDKRKCWFTEFTGVDKTHSGSAGHHIMEGRWLRDATCLKQYVEYWARGGGGTAYTYWFSHAAFEAYKVLKPGPETAQWLQHIYEPLKQVFIRDFIESPHLVRGTGTNGMKPDQRCFHKLAGWDAVSVARPYLLRCQAKRR